MAEDNDENASTVLDELGVPNCPDDLARMDAVERHGAYFWRCPVCGLTRL